MRPSALARFTALAALVAAAAACAPTTGVGPIAPAGPAPFDAAAFEWSAPNGPGGLEGRVDFRHEGHAYHCTGSVALTPETAYTRDRLRALYGSADRAALPEAVVRARTVPDANADYRGFVRSERCDANGQFRFTGLPQGAWYVIAPVSADSQDRFVLMRRIQTGAGTTTVTLD